MIDQRASRNSPVRILDFFGMTVVVHPDAAAASHAAADRIADVVRDRTATASRAVLGLATGATPEKVYHHLVAAHRLGVLSFKHVVTYNLDEYYPIHPLDPRSYRSYMHRHLFQHVDLPANSAHLLDGTVPERFVPDHCGQFERWIEADGGLDLQLLGIGRNGHIGFNEPTDLPLADALRLPTRLIELHPTTRADAARDFGDPKSVIPRALTMGVARILSARSILLLATGAHKAPAVAAALTGPITPRLPASLLRTEASKVTWLLDEPAAAQLP